MNFKFKLSKRLAVLKAALAASVVLSLACASELTDPKLPHSAPRQPVISANLTRLPATSVVASANDGNLPQNTLDNSLATRWSAQGDGQWIRYDVGAIAAIDHLDIAWYLGDTRSSSFDIQVSLDAVTWTKVFSGGSSGQTLQLESYAFPTTSGRYVRIVGHGNSTSTWNSITEVAIRGTALPALPVPVAAVTVSPATAILQAGAAAQLTAVTTDSAGNPLTGRTVSWTSLDSTVATVSASGLVKGVATGTTTITATSEGKSGRATISVAAPSCLTSAGIWRNSPVPTQTGAFEAQFDATPSTVNVNGVVGLANGPASDWTNLAAIVRFNTTGTIDARNGGVYAAKTAIPYTAGTSYHVQAEVVGRARGVGDGRLGSIDTSVASVDRAGRIEAHDGGQVGPIGGGAVGEAYHAVHVHRGRGGVKLRLKRAGLRRDGAVSPDPCARQAAGGRDGDCGPAALAFACRRNRCSPGRDALHQAARGNRSDRAVQAGPAHRSASERIPGGVRGHGGELRRRPRLQARGRGAHRYRGHGNGERGEGRAADRDFRNAVPGAGAVPMAHDADVAAGRRGEGVALELEGLPALAGEDLGPGDGVQRHLDVEGRGAGIAQVPGDVHVIDGCERAEVVPDPLSVALRRPAGGEAVVERVLREVAVIRARQGRRHGERGKGRAEDRDFRNAVPGAGAVPMAHDADVAAGCRREGVALELEGMPAAPAGEDLGPGDGVQRHLDVEG